MKKPAEKLNPATGLTEKPLCLRAEPPPRLLAAVTSWLLASLGLLGAFTCFVTAFSLQVLLAPLLLCVVVFPAMFTAAFCLKRVGPVLLLALALGYAGCLWVWQEDFVQGFILTANQMLKVFTAHSPWTFLTYMTEAAPKAVLTERRTIFIALIVFLFSALLCWAVTRRHSLFYSVAFTLPMLAAPLVFNITPNVWGVLCLLLFWACVAFGRLSPGRPETAAKAVLAAAPVLAASLALLVALAPMEDYVRSPEMEGLRVKAEKFVQELPATIANGLSGSANGDFLAHDQRNSSFSVLGRVRFTGKTALRVKVDNPPTEGNLLFSVGGGNEGTIVKYEGQQYRELYLKGFTGSVYSSAGWGSLSDREMQQLMRACAPLNPQNIAAQSFSFLSERQPTLTVQNLANKKLIYAPNWLSDTPNDLPHMEFVGDSDLRAKAGGGLDEYSLHYIPATLMPRMSQRDFLTAMFREIPQSLYPFARNPGISAEDNRNYYMERVPERFLSRLPELYAQKLRQEQAYASAIYDTYTQVPQSLQPTLNKVLMRREISVASSPTIGSVATYVAGLTKNLGDYTLSPGVTPAGRDMVEYFINENKKGYCVYFATAGVLLLRHVGIPARYAEGYVVTPGDQIAVGADGFAEITDRRSHAWAEYYTPGFGWVPLECTPGFSPSAGLVQENEEEAGAPIESAPIDSAPVSIAPVSSAPVSSAPVSSAVTSSSPSATRSGASLRPLFNSLLCLLGAVLAVLGRRTLLLAYRRRAFSHGGTNRAAISIYALLERLVPHGGELPPEATLLAQKARFSRHKLTSAELAALRGMLKAEQARVRAKSPLWRRFMVKYLLGLY